MAVLRVQQAGTWADVGCGVPSPGRLRLQLPDGTWIQEACSSLPYSAAVLADSPVLYLRLGDSPGSTVAVDSSGGAHDFTVLATAPPTFGQAGLVGDSDTAALFTGGNVFDPIDASWANSQSLTVEATIQTSTTGSTMTIIDRDYRESPRDWTFRVNAAGVLSFQIITTGGTVLDGVTPVNDGLPHHVAVTRTSGGVLTLYVDGAVDAVTGGASALSLQGRIEVGAHRFGSNHFAPFLGVIDEVAVYTTALSQAQIQSHAAGMSGGSGVTGHPLRIEHPRGSGTWVDVGCFVSV